MDIQNNSLEIQSIPYTNLNKNAIYNKDLDNLPEEFQELKFDENLDENDDLVSFLERTGKLLNLY